MAQIVIPTDKSWKHGKFENVIETASHTLQLQPVPGGYTDFGHYTSPVIRLSDGVSGMSGVSISRPGGDPGSIDACSELVGVHHIQRGSVSPPEIRSLSDNFKSYGVRSNIWSVADSYGATSVSQSGGKLNIQLQNVSGAKYWLKHAMQPRVSDGNSFPMYFILKLTINTFSGELGAIRHVGLFYGTVGDTVGTPTATNGLVCLRMIDNQASVFSYGGTSSNSVNITTPSEIWLVARFDYGSWWEFYGYYRTSASSAFTLIGSNTGSDVSAADNYLHIVVDNTSTVLGTVDVDVTEFVVHPYSKVVSDQAIRVQMWSEGDFPSGQDKRWRPIVYHDDFSNYTNGLDIKPPTTSTWEPVSEGLIASTDPAFPSQMQVWTDTTLANLTATIQANSNYARAYLLNAPNVAAGSEKKFRILAIGKDYGLTQAEGLTRGSFDFSFYHYRSSWASPGNWVSNARFLYVDLYGNSGANLLASMLWAISGYNPTLRPYFMDSTGTYIIGLNTVTITPSNFFIHCKFMFDVEVGRSWCNTYIIGGSAHSTGPVFLYTGSNGHAMYRNNYTVDTVIVTFAYSSSNAATDIEQRLYYPTLTSGWEAPCWISTYYDYAQAFATSGIVPARYVVNGATGDPTQFDGGNYVQTRVKLIGA